MVSSKSGSTTSGHPKTSTTMHLMLPHTFRTSSRPGARDGQIHVVTGRLRVVEPGLLCSAKPASGVLDVDDAGDGLDGVLGAVEDGARPGGEVVVAREALPAGDRPAALFPSPSRRRHPTSDASSNPPPTSRRFCSSMASGSTTTPSSSVFFQDEEVGLLPAVTTTPSPLWWAQTTLPCSRFTRCTLRLGHGHPSPCLWMRHESTHGISLAMFRVSLTFGHTL